MKNILILLFFAQIASAQIDTIGNGWFTYSGPSGFIACEPYEKFTPWVEVSQGDDGKFIHVHEWVYAEKEDVNEPKNITTLQYCPCGCEETEKQAKICGVCLCEYTRVRSYGFSQVKKKESKYMQIKNRLKQ